MNILQEIVEHKRAEVAAQKKAIPFATLEAMALSRKDRPALSTSLLSAPMGLIAEVKHRSPSAGVIRDPFEPPVIAKAYERGGAQALSVLMDKTYFGGDPVHMEAVRDVVSLPLLYKEFVVDAWQVWHGASLGASAILLIAAVLSDEELESSMAECTKAGVEALLEVHDEEEMKRAAGLGARMIGVNNRNLKTFEVSLDTSVALASQAPGDCLLVSESGIHTSADVLKVKQAGYQAVLVGEHLLREHDLEQAVHHLMDEAWASS